MAKSTDFLETGKSPSIWRLEIYPKNIVCIMWHIVARQYDAFRIIKATVSLITPGFQFVVPRPNLKEKNMYRLVSLLVLTICVTACVQKEDKAPVTGKTPTAASDVPATQAPNSEKH